jgi:hypothetical protein
MIRVSSIFLFTAVGLLSVAAAYAIDVPVAPSSPVTSESPKTAAPPPHVPMPAPESTDAIQSPLDVEPIPSPLPAIKPPLDTTNHQNDPFLEMFNAIAGEGLPETREGSSQGPAPSLAEFVDPPSWRSNPTLGFAGPSGVRPRSGSNDEFDTVEDRWRIGFPEWDRYGLEHPKVFDYPFELGKLFDPYNQNVLKGDYPIIGQHTFLNITATSESLFEGRTIPTATSPFESTARPFETNFFGRPDQFAYQQNVLLSFDLFQGDGAFKPVDWRVRLTPAFNVNTLSVQELAVVSPNVQEGLIRERTWTTLQEWFVEYKLADVSPEYDFVSVRAGAQPFTSDFRGFIFSDTNRGLRLFGNLDGNEIQYNIAVFRQLEKDTNSELNTFDNRNQTVLVANIYKQDFLFPGYTAEASFHFNDDGPSIEYDKNGFLVRPDPVGIAQPHRIEAYYLGLAGDGHIGPINVSNAFYWVLGRDSMNPLAGRSEDISAQMAALELSYDRDWVRFRVSGLYQSGDGNATNGHATGFDGILDQPNFAGTEFSFWGRQRIPLFGVGLVNDQSLYADLKSSRIQGQSNFVNPGLWLINAGMDFELTPRLRSVNNVNELWFDKTNSLELYTFQGNLKRYIGTDLSSGLEWRPRLNNNAIILVGASTLIPGEGFRDLYNNKNSSIPPLMALFTKIVLQF